MQTALYVSLSSQLALERRLTTLSGNVANINTTGFRATEIKFDEVLNKASPVHTSFVSTGEDYLATHSGGLNHTENQFDFAVKGDGWFQVEGPTGPMLTKDGRFTMTETGELLTINGYPVLDSGGGPIQLNPNAPPPIASSDGTLSQNGTRVASLGLFGADFSDGYERIGDLGIVPTIQPEPIVDQGDVGVLQGYLEESNVNAISEMSRLIMISRSFENVSALMRDTEKTFKEAIKVLGGGR